MLFCLSAEKSILCTSLGGKIALTQGNTWLMWTLKYFCSVFSLKWIVFQ